MNHFSGLLNFGQVRYVFALRRGCAILKNFEYGRVNSLPIRLIIV